MAIQLADERLQAEGEVLHRFTILELEVAYSCFSSWAVAFFAWSESTRIIVMSCHASLEEFFTPNDSLYSTGTAARIASNANMSSSSLSVPLSMAF